MGYDYFIQTDVELVFPDEIVVIKAVDIKFMYSTVTDSDSDVEWEETEKRRRFEKEYNERSLSLKKVVFEKGSRYLQCDDKIMSAVRGVGREDYLKINLLDQVIKR